MEWFQIGTTLKVLNLLDGEYAMIMPELENESSERLLEMKENWRKVLRTYNLRPSTKKLIIRGMNDITRIIRQRQRENFYV